MKINSYRFFIFSLLVFIGCTKDKEQEKRFTEETAALYHPDLKPFYHGVASGDPLQDRIILWTRVTPEDSTTVVKVKWEISTQPDFSSDLFSDSLSTSLQKDFTVKADVGGLKPGTKYFFRFSALGAVSETGETQTLPSEPDSLKIAVVSCANWEWGFFNAYEKISKRNDINAVIHLGDFIYEYATGIYGDTTIGRIHIPKHEIISLKDYRLRYAQYRLDKGLHNVSRKHPMICIWDDHEIANDSYKEGAGNHQPNEGDYAKRKAAARQAYYEWIPIRESENHYRTFSFGKLADLIMLDERLAGREKQVEKIDDPLLKNEHRTMLGPEQVAWLEKELKDSKAAWKIIGNQVIFSDMKTQAIYSQLPVNFDSWDGYPAEKKKLKKFILQNKIKDLIFLTGDAHSSWAIEVATDVAKNYSPFATEFVTTSISSGNGNERSPDDSVKAHEQLMLKNNPHLKYLNNRDHGYMLVKLTPQKAEVEWWFVNTLRLPESKEYLGKHMEVNRGSVKILP
ncbi:MAG: alkaline phosphatase D family protein [Bacteroidetes bacterium]|nr:alkaline phosphatase D family protein [Bacteroidota bacterium]